jgi:hypothetical protein
VIQSGGSLLSPLSWFGSSKKPAAPGRTQKEEEKLRKLTADYQSKRAEIIAKWEQVGEEATPLQIKPRKADIRVTHFGLAWVPCWRVGAGAKARLVPAYR